MRQNLPLHENYLDDEPIQTGSNRAFGCTVGSILIVIGAVKAILTGAVTTVSLFIFALGALLLLLGIAMPGRLSALNKFWLKFGILLSRIVNPIVLAVLFFLVITPMALVMRLAGKRPLRLSPDPSASSYWLKRELLEGEPSSMRRQF
jgi:large-conductance mechanosensitive channel